MQISKLFPLISAWLLSFLTNVGSMPNQLRVGVLYEPEFEGQWKALQWAAQDVNMMTEILSQTLIFLDKDTVQAQDSYSAQRKVCRMSNVGIAAMFGPMSSLSAAHVQSMCNTFEIPHIQWRWDPRDSRDYFSISLYPHYLTLSKAYKAAVKHWKWDRFTVLYENNDGLTRVQEVLKADDDSGDNPPRVTIRIMEMVDDDYLVLLKKLKTDGEFRFIIDCDLKSVNTFLKAALKLRMISELFHYFFTTLDLGLLDLSSFAHAGANITGYRLIDPERTEVVDVRSDWLLRSKAGERSPLMEYSETETALAYDAFILFAKALQSYSEISKVATTSLPCDKVLTWRHGNSLLNYMKSTPFEGMSGTVKYEKGERYDFNLDLLFLKKEGLVKLGTWNRKDGLNVTYPSKCVGPECSPNSKHYIVSTYEVAPYVVVNKSSPLGYSGFCVELLQMIATAKNFTFEIAEETTVGVELYNKTWTGVMGALIDRRAHIGIGDLTINWLREKQVDFSKPFLTLGITILYKKPAPKSLNLFSFLKPLSVDVWVYMLAAYLCVSFMLFVIARFSPYEWCNPHPCNPDTDEVENQFTVMNSLWFTIGSLMQQGCEIAPRALSTRLVAGIWWLFTLIMISSYTANLAAFLTVERMVADISSAEDLAKQTKIKYGLFDGGATMNFFKYNNMPLYERMWNFMNSTSDVSFIKNSGDAVTKVKKGNFAYITESTTVQYIIQRNCDLMQIGGMLDSKGYGFATPSGSPLREHITEEILRLKESQEIERLRVKWWEKEDGGGKCNTEESAVTGKAAALGVENVGGVFVVLMGGVAIGFLVSVCEFVWKANKNAAKDKQTLCSEMSEEFRFAVRCLGSKKIKKEDEEITDNGLQFMPLTGYPQTNSHGKEVYA